MPSGPPRTPPRTFSRVVKHNPPTPEDFMSYEALGIPVLDPSPETLRLRDGISVQATEAQARRKARGILGLGSYIARLEIPEDAPIRIERTKGPGHHTLWGEPAELLRCVVPPIIPVPPRPS